MNRLRLAPVLLAVLVVAISELPVDDVAASSLPETMETGPDMHDWRSAFASMDLDETFQAVAQRIRYEPYPGVMRGAAGTAIAGAGNAWDQSLLLATLLRERGYRVRFARGQLDPANLGVLLRGLYPPELPRAGLSFDFTAYEISADAALNRIATDHLWVEVEQAGGWLPLDAAFPRAQVGEAYAVAREQFDALPGQYEQRLTIRLKQQTAAGEVRDLFSDSGPVSRYALRPVWLTILASPLMPAEKKRAATLSFTSPGADESAAAPVRQGTNYHWAYGLDDLQVEGGTVTVLNGQPGLSIAREWLEMTIEYPGGQPEVVERELLPPDGAAVAAYRRLQLMVVTGRVPQAYVDEVTGRVGARLDLQQARETLAAAAAAGDLETALALDRLTGTLGPFLLALRFTAESDEMSDRVAWANGVAPVRQRPRLIIASVTSEDIDAGEPATTVELDLRLDRVLGLPFPGFPAGVARLFQTARGIQEAALEGSVLERFGGTAPAVTTPVLMEKALREGVELKVIRSADTGDLALPAPVRRMVEAAVKGGDELIIPARAVEISGQPRWGWWQVDADTGEVIGVMDNGLHSALTEYSLDLSEISLDDKTGLVIGAIVGATSTHITIAALILQYGESGAALTEQVEAILQRITCLSCPGASATVSGSAGASASVSIGGDCLSESVDRSIGAEGGVKLSLGSFCESYVRGFKCASGLILHGLTTEITAGADISANAEVDFGCD